MVNKTPPEILAYFKAKDTGDQKITDKEKRRAALEKAQQYKKEKTKIS